MSFRGARLKAGKRVREVMEHMKVSDACVYQWELGFTQPKADKLPKLAAFYGCSVDELLKKDLEEGE